MNKQLQMFGVTNQKGGLGKSTTTFNLLRGAQELGKKVLVADIDPQGNSSAFISRNPSINQYPKGRGFDAVFGLLDNPELDDLPVVEVEENCFLLPGTEALSAWNNDEFLSSDPRHVIEIGHRFRAWAARQGFDCVIFDTPTGQGLLQVIPLLWCDVIYVPIGPAPLAMHTLPQMERNIALARKENRALDVRYVVNMFMKASKTHRNNLELLRRQYGSKIVAEFKHSAMVSDSMAEGVAVWRYSGRKEVREAWRNFAYSALEA